MAWADANREVFDAPEVVGLFDSLGGWLDEGERAAVLAAAPLARGGRILDIGVGAGRTAGLLRLLSDDYVGIDYAPRMIASAQRALPGTDLRVGDARDLSGFPDASIAMVLVSNNAVDALDRAGRARALSEMARVLQPGGAAVLTTLNRDGRSYAERPWQLHRPGTPPDRRPKEVLRKLYTNGVDPGRLPRRVRNYLRSSRHAEDHGSWAYAPLSAHDFALVTHFETLGELHRELAAVGLETTAVFDSATGQRLPGGDEHSDADAFCAVALRPGG